MSVVRTYAKALHDCEMEAHFSEEKAQKIEIQIDEFLKLIDSSKEMRIVLFGPAASSKEKQMLISSISQKLELNPLLHHFFLLLARKGRLSLLPEIRKALGAVRLEARGGMLGRLVSAEPLSSNDIQDLTGAFSKKLGKPVEFQVLNDPSLLAGVKVTVNGVTYDGTLRSQLQQLRDRFFVSRVETIH